MTVKRAATDRSACVLFPRRPRETPSQPAHVPPPPTSPSVPTSGPREPTSGGACRGARHVGLQLEEIRGSGGGGGVFLALGMFWVSGYSCGCSVDGWGWRWLSCSVMRFEMLRRFPFHIHRGHNFKWTTSIVLFLCANMLNAVFPIKGLNYFTLWLAFLASMVFPLWLIMCVLALSYCFRKSLSVYKNISRCLWRVWVLLTFIT